MVFIGYLIGLGLGSRLTMLGSQTARSPFLTSSLDFGRKRPASGVIVYADDVTLLVRSKFLVTLYDFSQGYLNLLTKWSRNYGHAVYRNSFCSLVGMMYVTRLHPRTVVFLWHFLIESARWEAVVKA